MTLKVPANMEVHGVSEKLVLLSEFRKGFSRTSTSSTTNGYLRNKGFLFHHPKCWWNCQFLWIPEMFQQLNLKPSSVLCQYPSAISWSLKWSEHPRCCGMRCAEEISPSKQLVLSWVTHNNIAKVLNKRSNGKEKGDLTLGSRFHSRFTVKNNLALRKDQNDMTSDISPS